MANCEFFLIRYIPDLIRNEPVNIGVVLLQGDRGNTFAGVRFANDLRRVLCVDPNADLEMLRSLEEDIRNKLSSAKEREELLNVFRNLSNTLQISDIKACRTESPGSELEKLAEMYVDPNAGSIADVSSSRATIRGRMQRYFEESAIWSLMETDIPVSRYVGTRDPLKIDCGYRPNKVMKMFHAVSLRTDPDYAKSLAFSFPRMSEAMTRLANVQAHLTAVVEDDLDRESASIAFAFETFEESNIAIASLAEVPRLA